MVIVNQSPRPYLYLWAFSGLFSLFVLLKRGYEAMAGWISGSQPRQSTIVTKTLKNCRSVCLISTHPQRLLQVKLYTLLIIGKQRYMYWYNVVVKQKLVVVRQQLSQIWDGKLLLIIYCIEYKSDVSGRPSFSVTRFRVDPPCFPNSWTEEVMVWLNSLLVPDLVSGS